MEKPVCDHQDMGAELQSTEVEIVLLGVPRREHEKLHLDNSSAHGPRCAAGQAGLRLLKSQVGA